jgi:very-short-patch-repair endonuclease
MYKCERCGNIHDGTYGSGKFCCTTCAHKRIFSKESKEKLSKKLKGTHPKRNKKQCDKCKEYVSLSVFKRHYEKCNGYGLKRFKKLEICPFCKINIKDVHLNIHLRQCILSPRKNNKPKCAGWNKGKNKNNDIRIKKQSESLKQSWKDGVYDNVIHTSFKGKSHTEKTKSIIRQKRIEYLKNNFENTPWNKRKFTYGENVLYDIFLKNKLFEKYIIVNEYCEFPYFLDFAFVNEKVDVEYDGKVHFEHGNKRIEHDIKRDEYLKLRGWRIYRIPYYELTKFKIKDLISFIGNPIIDENLDKVNYMLKYKEYKEKQIQKIEKTKQIKENITIKNIEIKKQMILNSNINFTKFGWVNYVSEILNITPQNVNKWMKRNMLEFYNNNCFKRKINIAS